MITIISFRWLTGQPPRIPSLRVICARCFTMRPGDSVSPVQCGEGWEWTCQDAAGCTQRLAELPDDARSFADRWDALQADLGAMQ